MSMFAFTHIDKEKKLNKCKIRRLIFPLVLTSWVLQLDGRGSHPLAPPLIHPQNPLLVIVPFRLFDVLSEISDFLHLTPAINALCFNCLWCCCFFAFVLFFQNNSYVYHNECEQTTQRFLREIGPIWTVTGEVCFWKTDNLWRCFTLKLTTPFFSVRIQ